MLKRTLCILLAIVMVLNIMPPITRQVMAAEPGAVIYNRQILEFPVMTLNMSQNSDDFLTSPQTKWGKLNYGWKFLSGSRGLSRVPHVRYKDTHTYIFDDTNPDKITDMKDRGQLWVGYTLSMRPDKHGHTSHMFLQKIAYQFTQMYGGNGTLFHYSGGDNIENVLKNYGTPTDFINVSPGLSSLNIGFGLSGTCTDHGDPFVADISVYFADRQVPRLSSVFVTSDQAGTAPKQYFKENDTVYIHLQYDEPIRFSDNSANHDDVRLALNVARRASASNAGVETQFASLIALNDTRLTFQFDVPDTIYNISTNAHEATDHYIAGIKGSSSQTTFYGDNDAFELKYVYGPNEDTALPHEFRNNPEFTKTSCLITDLAGNPAQSFQETGLDSHVYLDTVDPEIAYVSLAGSKINENYTGDLDSPELDRSAVFAGVGDTLTFTVWFSESLTVSSADLTKIEAVLNVNDSGGNPVKATAVAFGKGKRNVEEKFDSTYITFAPVTIETGMTPVEFDGVNEKRISIKSITLNNGLTLSDPSGNTFSQSSLNIIKDLNITANRMQFLDVLAPSVSTDADHSGGKYTPFFYSGSDTSKFYFPVTPYDDTSAGAAYISGIDTNTNSGTFQWQSAVPFSFKFRVSASADQPVGPIDTWETGNTNSKYRYTQIDTGNYIHIALMDSESYNIQNTEMVVYPSDFAGNQGETVFPLDYLYDEAGPTITPVSYETGAGPAINSGYIKAVLRLEDPSMVDISKVFYRWYNNDTGSYTSDWVQYTGSVNQSAVSMELEFSLTGLSKHVKHDYQLLVKANDESEVVSGGNQTITDYNYLIDLTYPAYNFSYSTDYTAEPYFKINNLQKHPDTGEDSTVIVMIKDPTGVTGKEYFVRSIATGTENDVFLNHVPDGDLLKHFTYENSKGFKGPQINYIDVFEAQLWRYHTVETGDAKQYSFNDYGPDIWDLMNGAPVEQRTARRLQAMMDGKYYGDMEVTVIAGYGTPHDLNNSVPVTEGQEYDILMQKYPYAEFIKHLPPSSSNFVGLNCYVITYQTGTPFPISLFAYFDQNGILMENMIEYSIGTNYISYIPGTANVDVKTYTLKAASSSYALKGSSWQEEDTSHWWTDDYPVHNVTLTPTSHDLGIDLNWNNPSDGNKFRNTLDDEEFTVDIENVVISSWGISDVNFDSADAYFGLFLVSSPDTGAPISSTVPLWQGDLLKLANQTFRIPADVANYTGHYQVKVQVGAKGSGRVDSTVYDCYLDKTSPADFGLKSTGHSFTYTTDSGNVTLTEEETYSLATSRIYMGSQSGKEARLTFGAEEGVITDTGINYRQMFIKVWNGAAESTEGVPPAGTRWYDISTGDYSKNYELSFFDSVSELKATVLGNGATAGLGLVRNTENIIHYQLTGANGNTSAVRTLAVEVSDEMPILEMGLTPESSHANLQSATAFIKRLESGTMTEMVVKTVETTPQTVDGTGFTITDNSSHAFYTINAYGNFAFDTVTAPYVDSTAPTLTTFNFDGDMNLKNNLGIIFSDNMPSDLSKTKLYLRFDSDYMARLQSNSGLEVNEDGYMQVPLPQIPEGENQATWTCADSTAPGGIYKVIVYEDPFGGGLNTSGIFIYIDYLYDSTKPLEFDMAADFYAEDQAGNRSQIQHKNISILNKTPEVTGIRNEGNYDTGLMDIDLEFDKPVRVISPDFQNHTVHEAYAQYYHNVPSNEYSFSRDAFPVFGAGECTIRFMDVFGVEYTRTYDTTAPVGTPGLGIDFSPFGLDVSCSSKELTTDDVTVTITAQTEGTVFRFMEFPEGTVYSFVKYPDSFPSQLGQFESATIVLSESGHILLQMDNYNQQTGYMDERRYVAIPVTNILSHAPGADEAWYYSEFSGNTLPQGVTETTHPVTVYIYSAISSRPIEGTDGYSLNYTFPYGTQAGDTYTFTYTDEVGNIGTKTVSCPVSIVRASLPQEDKEAPNFTVKVYGKYGGVYKHVESWYSPRTETPRDADGNPLAAVTTPVANGGYTKDGSPVSYTNFRDLLNNMSWTGGYKLVFDVYDQNSTKIVLMQQGDSIAGLTYANANTYATAIEGVSVSGNTVTITNSDAAFKVAVVDDGNEHQIIDDTVQAVPYSSVKEMDFGGTAHWLIDVTPPTIDTALEYSGFYKVTAFFRLEDDKSTPTLVSPLWPTLTDAASPFHSQYGGWYYKEFIDHATIFIECRDEAYNSSSSTLEIGGIDSSDPRASIEWWSPSAYSVNPNTGEVTKFSNQKPNHKTNQTVRAGISFDKDITGMTLWWWDGAAYTNNSALVAPYAELTQRADFAVISFLQDAAVKLSFKAQNTKTGEIELAIEGVIDKTPPVVTIQKSNDTATSTSATLTFSISEDVTDLAGNMYKQADGPFTKEINARGTYKYTFTDVAGNQTSVSTVVSNIDDTPPVVIFKDMPDENTSVSGSYTFKAAMNEAGTITMLDQTAVVSAPTAFIDGKPDIEHLVWHEFTVTQNGNYLVTGTDNAGWTYSCYVSINCIDNLAPSIHLSPSTLRVRQETVAAALTDEVLLSGVYITDNVTERENITVTISGRPTQADLNTVGVYTVTITATDLAGNSREAQRYIRVYSKHAPEVLVNGIKTDRNGTTVIIGTYDLVFSVDIPGFAGEPYTLYIRQGDRTAGQMKNNAEVVKDGSYTVARDGYYTVYIVRQNREDYLTRLYMENSEGGAGV